MKLDRSRPFGMIIGADYAKYEQDGRLFNEREEPIDFREADALEETEETLINNEPLPVEAFLKTILRGGPIQKSTVRQLADQANLQWSDVQDAFAAAQGMPYNYKGTVMWKAPPSLFA